MTNMPDEIFAEGVQDDYVPCFTKKSRALSTRYIRADLYIEQLTENEKLKRTIKGLISGD